MSPGESASGIGPAGLGGQYCSEQYQLSQGDGWVGMRVQAFVTRWCHSQTLEFISCLLSFLLQLKPTSQMGLNDCSFDGILAS